MLHAPLQFSLLGQVRAKRGSVDLRLGSPQQKAVIATLLLHGGKCVSAERMVSAVWGEVAPRSALANVRTYAWRLKRELRDRNTGHTPLLSVGDGYQIDLGGESLDSEVAEQLAKGALGAIQERRFHDASDMLSRALGLWKGQPLGNVPGPFAEQERVRLNELRLALLEERIELDLQLGRHMLAIPELVALTAEQPLRERPYGQLMRALYLNGRQADAFDAFSRLRRRLNAELGVEPSPGILFLHQQLLQNDPELMESWDQMSLCPALR